MKIKICMLLSSILITVCAFAQPTEKGTNYMNAYKDIAINEMIRTGVPASITIAQGMLESLYGESDLAAKSNNHFGIKCKSEWTGDKVYHDDDSKGECFRVYKTAADSYKDHSDFLKNRPYYTSLFQLDPLDYEGWARGLKKCGYATETNYPLLLIKIINDYNLNQLSLVAMKMKHESVSDTSALSLDNNPAYLKEISKDTVTAPKAVVTKVNNNEQEVDSTEEIIVQKELKKDSTIKPAMVEKKKSIYPDSIFTINHSKVIFASAGTSLLSIATKYNISFDKLLDFNDLEEVDILTTDHLVFLERKLKKGATDFHLATSEETLYDICQKEGVTMKSLLEYNNFTKTTQPKSGQKILLRVGATNSNKTANIASSINKATSN
ncbi:MAG: glucosaminidase domain-containing protein [Bacteroidota bacterium]